MSDWGGYDPESPKHGDWFDRITDLAEKERDDLR